VRQPSGFESEKYPHLVYKLRKALYGLKQTPRAWYGRLRVFLFERGFEIGMVDHILFLLRQGRDILIVQVYVDDIVFCGSSNSLVARFVEDMSREFEMSMMEICSSSSRYISSNQRKEHLCTKTSTPRTL
jgi:hypothetical protein